MGRTMRALAVVLTTGAAGMSAMSGTATAQAASGEQNAQADVTCVGTYFSGTLGTNQALCNAGYKLTMQDNGDLVLRRSNLTACYASGTRGTNASATFHLNPIGVPYVDIDSPVQGWIGRIPGAHNFTSLGTNASLNAKGEFWVGYKKIGYC
ncbi:hypothetical protein [Streptomyces sp. NPDC001020]